MALGGGTFITQNKVIPGSYINFVSAAKASATVSDRGYVAMPVMMDWGIEGEIFKVELADLQKDSLVMLGYDYTSDKLRDFREVFKNAKTAFCYRINGGGTKASNDFATAKYSGTRGNDLKTVIATSGDPVVYEVSTYLGDTVVDVQKVSDASELVDNDFAVWKTDATLAATAGTAFTGGTNKDNITGTEYHAFLDKAESESFNILICPETTEAIKDLFVSYTKRMRDDCGIKFQTVVYQEEADYEGIINVVNEVSDAGAKKAALVYWVGGAEAGCAVNRSVTNKTYDGEYTVSAAYKQSELEDGIEAGHFMFHKVGENIRVLTDINSFVSVTPEKSIDFNSNQVMRVLDQVGNDIAVLFNTRYLGKVQNNQSGRISFWSDIVAYNKELETIQAIENFVSEDVTVEAGNDKKSVVVTNYITPTAAMEKLYMTVIVR